MAALSLPERVLPNSIMFGYATYGVGQFLQSIGSPRLSERYKPGIRKPTSSGSGTPLDALIQAVCREFDVNPIGILAKLQGETSYLTAETPPGKGHLAPMGYGCPDGGKDPKEEWAGPFNNIRAAAKWWGTFQDKWEYARRMSQGMEVNVAPEGSRMVTRTVFPRTAAEVAYLIYTPHVYSLYDFWGLLDRYWPGQAKAAPVVAVSGPTSRDMADVALEVGAVGEKGWKSHTKHGVKFLLRERGMCQRFARQVTAAALKKHHPEVSEWDHNVIPHSAVSAKQGEIRLKSGSTSKLCPVERVDTPTPGCLGYAGNNGPNGHVVVYVGHSEVAENTSSRTRGPGTVLSALEDISGITSWWRILPASSVPMVGDLKVVLDGTPIECNPVEVDGITTVDFWPTVKALDLPADLRVWHNGGPRFIPKVSTARLPLRELTDSFHIAATYKVLPDGRRRIYLKREV